MARNTIYQAEILDLVFLTRKKEYGAYLLRTKYDRHMVVAVFLSIAFFTTGISLPVIINKLSPKSLAAKTERARVRTIDIFTPIDTKTPALPKIESAVSSKPTIKFLPPKVTVDTRAEEYIPTVGDLKYAEAGRATVAGNPNSDIFDIYDEPVTPKEIPQIKEEKPTIYFFAEVMPEFVGGEEGLYSYLASNIKYPEIAKRAGVEGRVIIQFIVNKAGAITEISVAKGIGAGCDEEAMRVIKSMPNWKPGKQNGLPVSVRMTVPISFKLN